MELTREQVDQLKGKVLLEFGASWCPICQGFAPTVKVTLPNFPDVRHMKIEDGKGKPLGRSFKVKLWPNFVFIVDGKAVNQLARPTPEEFENALKAM